MQDNEPDTSQPNITPPLDPSSASGSQPPVPAPTTPDTSAYSNSIVEPASLATPVAVEQEVTQPAAPSFNGATDIPPTISSKPSKKKMIVAIIVAATLVLLTAGGVAAYNLWYQNPDKVVSDAVVNVFKAKTTTFSGSFWSKEKDAKNSPLEKFKLTIDGKSDSVAGEVNVKLAFTYDKKDYNLSGAGMYDKDANLYFKVNNIRKLIDSFNTSNTELPKAFDDIIAKIDSKWIKISAKDLKEFSPDYSKTQTCTKNVMKKFGNDQAITNEVVELYKNNKFIFVDEKLGSKDGSLGYVIDGDESKAKSFIKGFKNTTLFKELNKCDDGIEKSLDSMFKDDDAKTDTSKSRFTVWIDRWSHQFTKLDVTGSGEESEGGIIVEPTFNQPVTITVPPDVTTLSELQDAIEKAQKEYLQSIYGSMYVPPASTTSTSEL